MRSSTALKLATASFFAVATPVRAARPRSPGCCERVAAGAAREMAASHLDEARERGRDEDVVPPNEDRLDARVLGREPVQRDASLARGARDDDARQQRDADARADAADDAVERAEFEPPRVGDALPFEQRVEPRAVGAAGAEHEQLGCGCTGEAREIVERRDPWRRHQHELFRDHWERKQLWVMDAACDEGGLQAARQ